MSKEIEEAMKDLLTGKLRVVAPNSGMELYFDDTKQKFFIENCIDEETGDYLDEDKEFNSFEDATDFMATWD